MTPLATKGLCVERGGRRILSSVSVDVLQGRILGLVGPNGSGKSTLLRSMAGLWQAAAGNIVCDGRDLRSMQRREIARRITYVPQETLLTFDFSVRETVLMGRYSHRGRFERETSKDRDAAEESLRRTDVLHLADRSVRTLSGGERQRVLIARSLATEASILLLDEPTANLDVNHVLDVLDLCRSLARDGCSIVIATHDLNSMYRLVDDVALLEAGRVVAVGTPESVLTDENLARAFRVKAETLVSSDGTRVLSMRRLD
jgi:iron complex transport system ATP-binding protein